MPNNAEEIPHNNSILHSKLNNLCSSFTYSRSGIPVKSGIQSRLSQSFPSSTKPDVASVSNNSQLNSLNIMPPSSKFTNVTSNNTCFTPVDDNDNLIHSGNVDSSAKPNNNLTQSSSSSLIKPKKFTTSEHNFAESEKSGLSAFESKCLNICKKYPALSQKSGFKRTDGATLSQSTDDAKMSNEDIQRMSSSGSMSFYFLFQNMYSVKY